MINKPTTWQELRDLHESGEIEVIAEEDQPDGTTLLLIQDNRRGYAEGEIYELRI